MGPPLHSLALCGSLHEIEEQMYEHFLFTKPEIQARIAEYTQIAQAAEQEENKDDNSDWSFSNPKVSKKGFFPPNIIKTLLK